MAAPLKASICFLLGKIEIDVSTVVKITCKSLSKHIFRPFAAHLEGLLADMPLAATQVQPDPLQPKPTLATKRCEYCRK